MKTRNLLLGTVVLILAVGTAFASRALSADIYAKVYMTQLDEANHHESCLDTQATCEDAAGNQCRVRLDVQKQDAPDVTSATFKDDACSIAVFQSGNAIAESSATPWALVSPE